MKYDFKSQTAKLLREHQKNRQWLIAFLCLAVTVVLGTLAALKLYGQAMTHQVKVLECRYEVHKHTEECYKEGAEKELICGYADYVVHVHNDDCRDESGKLVCHLDEVEVHEHKDGEDGCWKEEKVLVCGEEETVEAQPQESQDLEPIKGDLICGREAHTHSDGCYSQILTCGAEEYTHGEGCYDEEGTLICTAEEHSHGEGCYSQELTCEAEEHAHEDSCYEWITPEAEEAQPEGHVHTDACYVMEKVLSCGKLELHTHTDECYAEESFDENGKLIEGSLPVCGLLQLEEHVHGEGCFEIVELTAEEVAALNAGATLHIHEESCYDEENNLICGHEVTHLHGLECYDEAGKLICEFAESHVHSAECYDEENNLICGYKEAHEHDENCYDTEGNLICGNEDAVDHVHGEGCYDAEGNLVCGHEVHEVFEEVQIYEAADHSYIVTARYNQDAELPENAQFRADMITPEMDSEHYAKREAEYREETGNENASMRALLKIGFYVDGEEVEPKAPVSITIQFLDEEGLAEGAPITVVHFAEEGTETLDGSHAKDDSTTFKMNGFSEIAIGYGTEEPREVEDKEDGTRRIQIDDTFEYEDDAFHMTFHIKGEAILPEGAILDEEKEDGGIAQDTMPVGQEEQPDEDEGQSDEEGSADVEAGAEEDISETKEDIDIPEEAQTEESTEGSPAEADEETPEVPQEDSTKKPGWEPKLQLKVELLSRDSEEYQAFAEDFANTNSDAELFRLQVMKYTLTYEGIELDLSECLVTVKIRMTKAFQESVEESVSEAAAFLVNGDGASEENAEEGTSEDSQTSADEKEASEPKEEVPVEDGTSARAGSYIVVCSEDNFPGEGDAENKEAADTTEGKTDDVEEGKSDSQDTNDAAESSESQKPVSDSVKKITIEAGNLENGEVKKQDSTDYDENGTGNGKELTITMYGGSVFGVRASGQPNPHFTVQYYANLDIMATTGTNAISLIDTTGKKMPVNGTGLGVKPNDNPLKTMYVDSSGKVQTVNQLTEVYSSRNFEYHKAPTINYMNALISNTNYELKEVWVLKDKTKANSIDKGYWDVYTYDANLHFTNREASADGKIYIHIADGAVVRFVYDTTEKDKNFSVAFYDYDISTGLVYRDKMPENPAANNWNNTKNAGDVFDKNNNLTSTITDWLDKYKHIYSYTKESGINSSENYNGSGTKLAFGNVNTGTGLGLMTWKDEKGKTNLINMYNMNSTAKYYEDNVEKSYKYPGANSYQGCSFGMVTGMSEGKIQYASGIIAPDLFNEGDAAGKTSYDNGQYTLQFKRVGDTYTLSAVNNTTANNLDSFTNPANSQGNYDGKHENSNGKLISAIWTNNFWPMDSAPSYGTGTHDVKFGGTATFKEKTHELRFGPKAEVPKTGDTTFPESDDGKYHNSYFGMHYEVEFDLVRDYVGPLEYYFFGDDDMWVFLDGKLVCDIGGVHSSVGEYVNLWDYLHKHEAKCYNEEGKLICKEGITHEHDDEKCYGKDSEGEKVLTCKENTKKLSFFYTERGASGSTCWMQFTLPSVSSLTPETTEKDYGELRIEKTVTQINDGKETVVDNGDEFRFTINFVDPDGNNLPDDYSYVKYDKNGKELGHDLIIWDGGSFTLKNGEYIVVKHLPQGTRYTITESDVALTVITENSEEPSRVEYFTDIMVDGSLAENKKNLDGSEEQEKTAKGTIPKGSRAEVKYNNKFYVYALPESGGPGTILYTMAGAMVTLFGAGLLYRKKFRERRA